MAQVSSGFDAASSKRVSIVSPSRNSKTSKTPLQLSAEIPSETPNRAPLRIDYTQAAGDLPSPYSTHAKPINTPTAPKENKGIPPSLLAHVTPQPYKYTNTSPKFASVKAPGSTVQPNETAASISNAAPLPIPAASNKALGLSKENKGIPPSLLQHVTPQPYKYTDTSPKFSSVKAPGSAVQPKDTAASIPNAPPLPIPAPSSKAPLFPKDSKSSPPSVLPLVSPQPYKYNDTSPKFASVKAPSFAATSANAQQTTLGSKPVFPSGPDNSKVPESQALFPKPFDKVPPTPAPRLSAAATPSAASNLHDRITPTKQSAVSTESNASTFAQSSISSVPTPAATDPNFKKGSFVADKRKSEPSAVVNLTDGRLPEPRKSEPASSPKLSESVKTSEPTTSAPLSKHTVGFAKPSVTGVVELQALLNKPEVGSKTPETNQIPAKSDTESNKFGGTPLFVKSDKEPVKSDTSPLSDKLYSGSRISEASPFPAKKDTESGKSGPTLFPAKTDTAFRKSGTGLAAPKFGAVTTPSGNNLFSSAADIGPGKTGTTPSPVKSGTEPRKSGIISVPAKSGTDTRKSGINLFAAKSGTEPRKSGIISVPAKSGTELGKSGTTPASAKSGTEPRKAETSPHRSTSGSWSKRSRTSLHRTGSGKELRKSDASLHSAESATGSRKSNTSVRRIRSGLVSGKLDTTEHPSQSKIDLSGSQSGIFSKINAGFKKSESKAPHHKTGLDRKRSDLSSGRSGSRRSVVSQASNLSLFGSRKPASQPVDPRTKIVSSSSRPRLAESGYKRAIPLQAPSRKGSFSNQPLRRPSTTTFKDRKSSQSKLGSAVARKRSSLRHLSKAPRSRGSSRPKSHGKQQGKADGPSSAGADCKALDKTDCKIDKSLRDCNGKTGNSEFDKCWRDIEDTVRDVDFDKCCRTVEEANRNFDVDECCWSDVEDNTCCLEYDSCMPNLEDCCQESGRISWRTASAIRACENNRPNRNAACDAVMPIVHPITAGSTDACLPVSQWQPAYVDTRNCSPCPQRRTTCSPVVNRYRSGAMCDPCCTNSCDPPACSPCPRPVCPRPVCSRPCSPCPRPVCPRPACPRPCSPCPRPVCPPPCSPCPRPVCPPPCSPCPRPVFPPPCSPCPRPVCPPPCSPCPRPVCPPPCSPCPRPVFPQPACYPCDPPICPRPCSPRQCSPCDPPVCPSPCSPALCSPCQPPACQRPCDPPMCSTNYPCYQTPAKDCCYTRPKSACCEVPDCFGRCRPMAYPCRKDCDPDCDLNQCKPLVKPASREVPDNFKLIAIHQQQFLVNGAVRNAAAATATATNYGPGMSPCAVPEPLCTPCVSPGNPVATCGQLRHVASCDLRRDRCAWTKNELRPTQELQRILQYRRGLEEEREAMEAEACGCDYDYNCSR